MAHALALAALLAAPRANAQADASVDADPPVIDMTTCQQVQRGRPFTLYARFEDASAIFEPKLIYRARSDKNWASVPFVREGDLWLATVPARELKSSLEYFVEVFDAQGNGPSRRGSPDTPVMARITRRAPECERPTSKPAQEVAPVAAEAEPVTLEPTMSPPAESLMTALTQIAPPPATHSTCDQDSPPFYCSALFWVTASAVVLAGAGTAAYFMLRDDGSSTRYPGSVNLVISGPGPGDALVRGSTR